jgi:hypothetical protein
MGFAGIGLAAAAAGQAVIFAENHFSHQRFRSRQSGPKQIKKLPRQWQSKDLILDAVMGLLLFKVCSFCFCVSTQ